MTTTYHAGRAGDLVVGDHLVNLGGVSSVRADGVFRVVQVETSTYSLGSGRGVASTTTLVFHMADLLVVEAGS